MYSTSFDTKYFKYAVKLSVDIVNSFVVSSLIAALNNYSKNARNFVNKNQSFDAIEMKYEFGLKAASTQHF